MPKKSVAGLIVDRCAADDRQRATSRTGADRGDGQALARFGGIVVQHVQGGHAAVLSDREAVIVGGGASLAGAETTEPLIQYRPRLSVITVTAGRRIALANTGHLHVSTDRPPASP